MTEKNTETKFQRLVRIAVGPVRSQSDFSVDSGVSPSHLNRLLNGTTVNRPTANTLKRIAEASEGRVTAEQLAQAWEQAERAPDEMSEKPPFSYNFLSASNQERNNLMEGLQKFAGVATAYDSFDEMLDMVITLYMSSNATVFFQDKTPEGKTKMTSEYVSFPIPVHGHKNAERCANVVVRWEDDYATSQLAFTAFLCETTGGSVIFSDVAFDLQTLIAFQHYEGLRLLMKISEKENQKLSDYPYVDRMWLKDKGREDVESCQRLLNAIFGEKEEQTSETGETKEKDI